MQLIHQLDYLIINLADNLANILTNELCDEPDSEEAPFLTDELTNIDHTLLARDCITDRCWFFIQHEFFLPVCEELVKEW